MNEMTNPGAGTKNRSGQNTRIGFLWASKGRGFYAVEDFDKLYAGVGHNNGNLAFVYALENQFEGTYLHMPWHARPEHINASCDIVVIPCANQLGKHTDLGGLARNIRQLDCPVIAIGLGAQAKDFDEDVELSEGTADWLDALLENGQRHGITNIYTRGPYTSAQIRKLTGAEVQTGGCPTHFISRNPQLGQAIQRNWDSTPLPRAIAVAGGHQAWGNIRQIEQQLIGLMMDPLFPGIYVPQSMADMIKISRGLFDEVDPTILDRIRQHTVPHYSLEAFKLWANRFAKSYYDVPAWADDLRRMDLVIGARYHGCAIAIQAERMACTITIDSRTEEMCRETGVPFLRAQDLVTPLTRHTLKSELIRFDADAFDVFRRRKCKTYMDFLTSCGLKPASYLHNIAAV
jgi:hypothetical protein